MVRILPACGFEKEQPCQGRDNGHRPEFAHQSGAGILQDPTCSKIVGLGLLPDHLVSGQQGVVLVMNMADLMQQDPT